MGTYLPAWCERCTDATTPTAARGGAPFAPLERSTGARASGNGGDERPPPAAAETEADLGNYAVLQKQ